MVVSIFLLGGGSFLTDVAPKQPHEAIILVQAKLIDGELVRGAWNTSNNGNAEAAYRSAMRNGHAEIVRFNPNHVRFLTVKEKR